MFKQKDFTFSYDSSLYKATITREFLESLDSDTLYELASSQLAINKSFQKAILEKGLASKIGNARKKNTPNNKWSL